MANEIISGIQVDSPEVSNWMSFQARHTQESLGSALERVRD
jgi:hypothetical protein